jgi:hypothetical protein
MSRSRDEEVDRIDQMLVAAIEAIRRDDFIGAELLLKETAERAQRLPKTMICLPETETRHASRFPHP